MNRDVYKHLLATYGRRPLMWLGFLLSLVNVVIIRVYAVILWAEVAANVAGGNIHDAKRHILYYLISYIAGSAFGVAGELLSLRTENNEYGKLMMEFHHKLINKDMSFYRDNQTGYLASVFRQYLDSSLLLVRFLRGEASSTVLSLIFPAIVLTIAAPKVGLIAIAIIVVQVIYIFWASSKAMAWRHRSNEIYRKITGEVADEITNIVALKSSGAEQQAHGRIAELRKDEVIAFWFRRKISTVLDFPRSVITAVGISAAAYVIVTGSVANNSKSLGLIVLTLTYMFQIVRNVVSLPELINTHDDFVTRMYPTLAYLNDDHELIRDPKQPKNLNLHAGAISIEHVTFSYHTKAGHKRIPVFSDLNIAISGGEQIGIVGLSGAGKSTLANLLLRFDEVEAGSIRVDDIDIREVRQSQLRQHIGYVPQEPLLFHRTVRENIAYYDAAATEKDIVRAAKAAHAHEFIQKLPEGYDTVVGERGVKLSGGQKQRVAIARAVLKKAPIMIFDEATSALDSESEQIIQRALPEILGKQTAIVVAHRLSTVAGLDRIIVMHDGKVVEQGTHAELLKQKGRYNSLWQKQTTSEKTT